MKKQIFAASLAAFLAAALMSAPPSFAQNYPSRPITMVVPLGVGGSTDVVARIVAQGMGEALGQTIVVENTTGAGGTIGEGRISRATPDGYTIGIGQWGTNVASGAIYNLPYDLMKDFEPVGLIATQPFFVVARKDMPANNLKELMTWLRANGDKANEGNSGVGTPSHVGGILFQKAVGAPLTMVPYRGAGDSTTALLAGQIDVMLNTPALSVAQMRAGQIKVYAVTAKERIAMAPEVPTTDEAGLPGFYFSFWHAIWAPKGTPKDIVAKLNAALKTALASPATRKRLTDIAQDIYPPDQQTPEALRTFQQAEIDKWWPIIKAANIKMQ
ncbi:MAG TPA: tripartite tricarboxylate transporter substrate-binding protein [Pseudolabrys sp.]|nr:tripartite tricarboxylate transporter substrate-binding protein [Pseudolabrys sp.]